MGLVDTVKQAIGGKKKDPLIDLSGELKLSYFHAREDSPSYVTGTYGSRGVTIDQLNDRGHFDNWHKHTRVIISLNTTRQESHIVCKKGGFYSRKLGEVDVANQDFKAKYSLLSTNPDKASKIVTDDVARWVVKLKMPFSINGGQVIYHENSEVKDKTRIRHIVDALCYIAKLTDKSEVLK